MRYWDTSAILPLLVRESGSGVSRRAFRDDARMAVWWGTRLECASALARVEREASASLSSAMIRGAFSKLEKLAGAWVVVQPGERIIETALRLIRVHPLRAADALQLAAAVVASDLRAFELKFVCFDKRLAMAAEKEGFDVVSA